MKDIQKFRRELEGHCNYCGNVMRVTFNFADRFECCSKQCLMFCVSLNYFVDKPEQAIAGGAEKLHREILRLLNSTVSK